MPPNAAPRSPPGLHLPSLCRRLAPRPGSTPAHALLTHSCAAPPALLSCLPGLQIAREAQALLTHHQFKADVVYGGTNISRCGAVWCGWAGVQRVGCLRLLECASSARVLNRSASASLLPPDLAPALPAAYPCAACRSERKRLAGRCDVLVATPGRLIDHLENGGLAAKLQGIRTLVSCCPLRAGCLLGAGCAAGRWLR